MTISNKHHSEVQKLSTLFRTHHRIAGESVERAHALFGTPWLDAFETLLSALFPSAESLKEAAKGYATFAMHSMRLQAAFERERQYKAKTHAQAASEVYFNEAHMQREYLPGLLLSHFLWPHHYRQIQFFESAFVQAMHVAKASSFVEVGIGTGLYSSIVLRALPGIHGLGFDISPSSKRFTENHLLALGVADRYRVALQDVTQVPLESPTQWLICVEVLEHLEDPVSLLRALRQQLAPGGKAFITAAINAAHADHIYLYRTADEVGTHLLAAGFKLEQWFAARAYPPSNMGVPVPEAVAFVVN